MTEGFVGANVAAMRSMSDTVKAQADTVQFIERESSYRIARLSQLWVGAGANAFHQEWFGRHAPALRNAAALLDGAAMTIRSNADNQEATSATMESGGGGSLWSPGSTVAAGHLFQAGSLGGIAQPATDFLLGDVANLWNGGADGFPTGSALAALLKMGRVARGELPLFNTGFAGRNLAALLSRGPGALPAAGLWLQSPAASTFFRRAGIVGAAYGTITGGYDLYQQGNPIDAYRAEGAGYVADVASTAFSASTGAFLLAPNPVTGALVIGTGAVWLGAEIVDNWDGITDWTSNTWDAGSDFVDSAWDHTGGAVISAGGDAIGGAWDAGTDLVGDVGGFVGSLKPDWF